MNNIEFCDIAKRYVKTQNIYVMGGWGQTLSEANIKTFCRNYPYNHDRYAVLKAHEGFIAMDCSGLVKCILWGNAPGDWKSSSYTKYGIPDINANTMETRCRDRQGTPVAGDLVWMPGHIGIYVGNGKVVESTPRWNNGIQLTDLKDRDWKKVLINSFISYCEDEENLQEPEVIIYYSVQKGDNLTKIAKNCKIPYKELIKLNPQIKDVNKIYPGDKIRIK